MLRQFIANVAALCLATYLVPGITLGAGTWQHRAWVMALVALIFGIANALVKPVLEFFGTCLIILTLGLFIWVINAAMLMLTSWASGKWNLGWNVADWRAAFLGALIVSVTSMAVAWLIKKRDDAS